MKYCLWIILLLTSIELFAQNPLYTKYERYDVENGLPQNLVSGIVQDADGFIWVSTLDGLARFDGEKFMAFRHQPGNQQSLQFNSSSDLIIDNQNKLWLEYVNYQYDRFDPMRHIADRPKALSGPARNLSPVNFKAGLLQHAFWGDKMNWLRFSYDNASKAPMIQLFDTANVPLRKLFFDSDPFTGRTIYAINEDTDKDLWLVSDMGFEIYDSLGSPKTTIAFPQELALDSEKINFKVKLMHLADQRVVILEGPKVVIYHQLTGEFKSLPLPNPSADLVNFSGSTIDLAGRPVFEYQNHIYRLEKNNQLSLLWVHPTDVGIRTIFIDRSNSLWIGTDPDGLYKVNLSTPDFQSAEYVDDFLTDIFIEKLGISASQLAKNDFDAGSAYNSRHVVSKNGELVSAIFDGQRTRQLLKVSDGDISILANADVRGGALAFGPNNRLHFLSQNGEMLVWEDLSSPPKRIKTGLYGKDYVVIDIEVGTQFIWVATQQDGVLVLREGKIVEAIQLEGNYALNDIYLDASDQNILWMGTSTGGLYKWDIANSTLLTRYQMEQGLPNNTINCIVPDQLGNLWISTNKGISRFNPTTEVFTNYAIKDGLLESEFNRRHALTLPNGHIAMGGTKGYAVFDPIAFLEDTTATRVSITDISINNQPVNSWGDTSLINAPLNLIEHLYLSYADNTIGLSMAAMQYNAPEKNEYRYQLEGYDRTWVEMGNNRLIKFNQLPYGNYTLLLNASNTNGTWSTQVRKIKLTVHPPFWLTWWAYLIYALLIAVVVQFYWKLYKKRLINKQEAIFNAREAARLLELDETKTRFFSNITHEFRTPLTLILSPLEKHLNDSSFSPKALTLLNNNYRHASQLLKLVNQLLDINKLEASQMAVNQMAGDLNEFTSQCVEFFSPQVQEKGLQLNLRQDDTFGPCLFDHEKLEKILFNLLSNAVKFTPSGGVIEIELSRTDNSHSDRRIAHFQIRDTGIGISEKDISKVFERFYQADDSASREYEGTGIGLSLVKELVVLLGGKIDVKSEMGIGTTFQVDIPIESLNQIPAKEDMTSIGDSQGAIEQTVPGVDHKVPIILVIEDNDELRSFITESLTERWQVLSASNGLDGWAIIERELPEIVISDVMMPGMNGFELCSKSKNDPRTSHVNFILLTAKAAQESKLEGLELGADAYLTKPFNIKELELILRNLLLEQFRLRNYLNEKLLPGEPSAELPHVNDAFINKLIAYIDDHIDDSKIQAVDVAKAMNMSKSTLNRKLSAILGTSINDYIRKYRLQKASILLSEGYSVSEVSFRVGFESSSYFAQCFKEHFRKTPSEFSNTPSVD